MSVLQIMHQLFAKRNVLMGCRRIANELLASEQRQLVDDSLAVSLINGLLIQAPPEFNCDCHLPAGFYKVIFLFYYREQKPKPQK